MTDKPTLLEEKLADPRYAKTYAQESAVLDLTEVLALVSEACEEDYESLSEKSGILTRKIKNLFAGKGFSSFRMVALLLHVLGFELMVEAFLKDEQKPCTLKLEKFDGMSIQGRGDDEANAPPPTGTGPTGGTGLNTKDHNR